jgi:hypothetical protein
MEVTSPVSGEQCEAKSKMLQWRSRTTARKISPSYQSFVKGTKDGEIGNSR